MFGRFIAISSIILIVIGFIVFGKMLDLDKKQAEARLNRPPFSSLSDPDGLVLYDPNALVGTCVGPAPFVLNAGFFDPTFYKTAGSRGAGVKYTGYNITLENPTMKCSSKLKLPPVGVNGGTSFAFCLPADDNVPLGSENYANVAKHWPCASTSEDNDRRYRFVKMQIKWPFVSPPDGHLDLRRFDLKTQKRMSEYDGHIFKREGNTSLAISCRLNAYLRVDKRKARWCVGDVYDHTENLIFRIKYASPSESQDDEAWREPVKHAIALAKQGYAAAQIQK